MQPRFRYGTIASLLFLSGAILAPAWERDLCGSDLPVGALSAAPNPLLSDIECREAMKADSQRTPDRTSQAKTQIFLGDQADWPKLRAEFRRGASYGLDQVTIRVTGDGQAVVWSGTSPGTNAAKTHTVSLSAAEVNGLFNQFIAHAFTSIAICNRPGVPDEILLEITLTNARGKRHRVAKWGGDKHKEFDVLFGQANLAVRKLSPEARKALQLD